MWEWIAVGLGSFVALSFLVTFMFARVLGALNGEVVGLLEDRSPMSSARAGWRSPERPSAVGKREDEESPSPLVLSP